MSRRVLQTGRWGWLAVAIWCGGSAPVFAAAAPAGPIRVEPAQTTLVHPQRPQSVLVLAQDAEGFSLDLTDEAQWQVADPKVARLNGNWIEPVANGQTQITVRAGGQQATIAVTVRLPETAPQPSFVHDVMPVLSKGGCNMGACHGYSLGKNGFKLTLRGADPIPDFFALTKEFQGRRIDFTIPAESLSLTKASGDAPHKGGVRFRKESLPYRLLLDWISAGAPDDLATTVQFTGLRIAPRHLVLRPEAKHRLQLIAEYSDGAHRDVTRLGVFTMNNDQVAEVADDGRISALSLGETAAVVRFERKFQATTVIVRASRPSFAPTPVPKENLVDRHVIEKLNLIRVQPSPLASDEVFLRRVHLDLIGIQPTPDELLAFVSDPDPNKRSKVVDALMARGEFVDWWSLKWGDLLQNSRLHLGEPAVYAFREWIRGAVASNKPFDRFARELLTSRGGYSDDPATGYLAVSKDTFDTVERVAQVFCGVRMLCARCHPHPMENWTQADYYGVASFFTQLTKKNDPRAVNDPKARIVGLNLAAGDSTNPRTNKAQPAQYLGGGVAEISAGVDRREAFAAQLTSAKNPFFARGMANRVWSYFFHRGIIEPVDDLRSTNPPVNPELLDGLTQEFIASKFDVRRLMRLIVTSETYQRSSVANETNDHDTLNFSHAIPRRLPAESLLDSLVQATGVKESFSGMPGDFSARQLPDANVNNTFLNLFGKPQRMEACECERDGGSNMLQALHFINGNSILNRVSNPNGRVAQLLKQKDITDEQLIEQLYLWSLSRRPTEKELAAAKQHVMSYGEDRPAAFQDLMWGLLNSKDFMLVQ